MANTATSRAERIEELIRRSDQAAFEHPNLAAVVMFRPDLRQEQTELEARRIFVVQADPTSENYGGQLAEEAKTIQEAMRRATTWESWIPPGSQSIEQSGGERYLERVLRAGELLDHVDLPGTTPIWRCVVFGPATSRIANAALNLFCLLAENCMRCCFPDCQSDGNGLISHWLIHLADRPAPICPDAQRRYLSWHSCQSPDSTPSWIPVTPQNPLTCWWAARLPNLIHLSRRALEQYVDSSVRPQNPGVADAKTENWADEDSATRSDSTDRQSDLRVLKQPTADAITVFRYRIVTGKTQIELANDKELMRQLGRSACQGTISRWLQEVAEWLSAGNILPSLQEPLNSKPIPMNPTSINKGRRTDGRAKRTRQDSPTRRDD